MREGRRSPVEELDTEGGAKDVRVRVLQDWSFHAKNRRLVIDTSLFGWSACTGLLGVGCYLSLVCL